MTRWDKDREDAIIQYVREHPCFYNTKSPDYKNRDLRSAEWENLAGKFDVTVQVMKAKWKALNDAFNRCLKEKSGSKSGSGAEVKPKWVHFEKMQFLAPFRTARETQTSLVEENEEKRAEVVDLTQNTAEEEEQAEPESGGKRMGPPPSSTPVSKKMKPAKVPPSPSLDDAFKETLATITEQMNKAPSETQLFTDHLGTQLEKLSARRQLKAKDAIQRIVSQALDDQYAEEESASGRSQWQSQPQILPPTQPSQ